MVTLETAALPVARFARFLLATKASPRERLPAVHGRIIGYAAKEVIAGGMEPVAFVVDSSTRWIKDHVAMSRCPNPGLQAKGSQKSRDKAQNLRTPG